MKTPRELLLEKHAADASALDALRQASLPEARVSALGFLRLIFGPQRVVWGALAVVWTALVILASAGSPRPATVNSPVSPQEMMAEWTANKDNLHDLLAATGPRH